MSEFRLRSLPGLDVIDSGGALLGRIEDVVVDDATWRVASFVVEVDRNAARDLGVAKAIGRPRIELTPERVQAVGDTVVLNVGAADVARILHADEPMQ